ncbi:MAG: hypothetical protein A3E01_06590 [Gammaproteobacteria bacterium RIFCSPHIGHO2_12_FULL_63_22]|nr:MAG: hypothetical protein A3E01_06590 [Gammaproteobacteria bacterium RIFCSPHIGHO2_12_FULL_63_22]
MEKTYTLEPWAVASMAKMARHAHTRAIQWKRRYKASLTVAGANTAWYYERYVGERGYARAIMMVLTSVNEHQGPDSKAADRRLAERLIRETVV